MTRIRALGVIFIVIAAFVATVLPSGATNPPSPNTEEYWEASLSEAGYTDVSCYKYGDTGSNSHGGVYTDENGVTYVELNEFQDEWPGDQWVLLVVKGGSDTNGGGDATYYHPDHDVAYYAPDNPQSGKPFGVSHWIVCKGTRPATTTTTESTTSTTEATTTTTEAETTTSTTEAETTTTTEVETTTTTEAETTTTTEAETTTTSTTEPTTTSTTTVDETTTTVVDDTTTSTVVEEETSTTAPSSRRVTPSGNPLPRTGSDSGPLVAVAAGLLVIGLGLVFISRRKTA